MAPVTLYLVLRDMVSMHLFTVAVGYQDVGLGVTLDADVVLKVPVSLDNVEVALAAKHAIVQVLLVDEGHILVGVDIYLFACLLVADSTLGQFRLAITAIEMAGEAGGLGDGQVLALYDLGMASDATQLFAATHIV